jgi:hypothetical protein
MALFTLTISNFATPLEKQNHEVERIHKYVNLAIQDVRGSGGKHTSGNILDNGGTVVVGSWTYTPQATN